jgi:hypothetical protein
VRDKKLVALVVLLIALSLGHDAAHHGEYAPVVEPGKDRT